MDVILGRVPGTPARSFYDDVQIPGTCWRRNWRDTVNTVKELAQAGFMLNLRKCAFLQPRVTMVGMEICAGSYRLAQKSLKRWVGATLPRSLVDLQTVLGRLLWASPFVPNYKELVKPMEALLSPKSGGDWTGACTEALNRVLRVIEQRLTLAIANPDEPIHVFVDVGAGVGMGMLAQDLGGDRRAVALVSRSLTAYEAGRPPLEQKLHLARWALHRCRRFTAVAPKAVVHIPEPEGLLVIRDKTHHLRIDALMVDLASYKVEYVQAEPTTQMWLECLGGVGTWQGPSEEGKEVVLPTFEHQDRVLVYPAGQRPLPTQVEQAPHWSAYFDGGAASRLGTGGFVVFDGDGICVAAVARFYGDEVPTNNRAEVTALKECMEWLAQRVSEGEQLPPIVIFGDSQLVINFCNRRARPSVGDLYEAMQRVHGLRKDLQTRVFFRHVPRENNKLADWLTNVARGHKASGVCTSWVAGLGPQSDPPCPPGEVEFDGVGLVAPLQPLTRT